MKSWRITWGERSWTADDLTGRHLVLIVLGLGADGWDIDPVSGPVHLIAVLAACVAVDTDTPLEVVTAELSAMPASTLVDALTFETG